MSEVICERCDQPFGDSDRADNHPAVMEWSAWIEAGGVRTGKHIKWSDVIAAVVADQPGKHTELTCFQVNWRTEALQMRSDLNVACADRDRLAAEVERIRTVLDAAVCRVNAAETERDDAIRARDHFGSTTASVIADRDAALGLLWRVLDETRSASDLGPEIAALLAKFDRKLHGGAK